MASASTRPKPVVSEASDGTRKVEFTQWFPANRTFLLATGPPLLSGMVINSPQDGSVGGRQVLFKAARPPKLGQASSQDDMLKRPRSPQLPSASWEASCPGGASR